MMFDDDLYQELIMDHNRRPRNFRELPDASHEADGNNPLCGDKLHVAIRVTDGVIEDIAFTGSGCAISQASASLMTEALKGQSVQRAHELFEAVRKLVTSDDAVSTKDIPSKVMAIAGVREFPMRVKCATLAWHTMLSAIDNEQDKVTTEQ